MGLGSCYTCIKYMMFAFNFLFWLLGCAILGVGIWLRVDPNFKKYIDGSDAFNYLYTGAYLLIVVGVVIMVIGFLGCCGTIRESQCMLVTFFVFLFIIFAALLAAGIWAIMQKETLKKLVEETLTDAASKYDKDVGKTNFMDDIHKAFKCCGATRGLSDFGGKPRPASCPPDNLDAKPCANELFTFFADNMIIIAGVAIGIGVIMMLGMIFAMCLCCEIRNSSQDHY